ncbi:SpaH/EbpB family LPXTG-anchored major pilin [Microbacterium koreense]|uniref:SpaH/EbpB family LPXTG-anchored major pilin n=2 Tax=Microbacterium koreense TaxID=323761 RepID=A0ABW2ZT23_9MICO
MFPQESHAPTRRGLSLIAAAALVVSGLALGASAAQAVPVPGPVDGSATGSVTVHKYAYPADGAQDPSGTGTDPTSDPIAGVTFALCAIGNITSLADTSNAGWPQVNGLDPLSSNGSALTGSTAGADTTTSFPLSGCTSQDTDGNGEATWGGLAVGAYLVTETAAPAGVIIGDPFIVTVPTPADASGGAENTGLWEYDVNVYPKNLSVEAPSKTIGDQPTNGVVRGDEIDFSITQLVPTLADGETYVNAVLTDTLDELLDLVDGSVVVSLDGSPLATPGDYALDTTDDVITVTLSAAGLAQLSGGQTLSVEFAATANANGAITNQAFVNINDLDLDGDGNGGENPTPEVTTRWGGLLGEKTDAAGTNALGGAEFAVFMTTDTDGSCDAPTASDIDGLTPVTSVTSVPDGSITIAGLWVGDSNDDVANRCYILQETAAPAGFVLPTGDAALTSVNIATGEVTGDPTFTVENDQQLLPGIPITGADGQMLLTVGGTALLLIAAGAYLVARKRTRALDDAV